MRDPAVADRERARLHLLDWIGCVAGALRSPVADILREQPDRPAVAKAAWLGNVLEMDDVHRTALLHPGPIVWPTALAGGVKDSAACLDAALRGYDAMIAVGRMLDPRHYSYWHNTATAGSFGAAATAASLLGCDMNQMVSALGFAGSVTGGLWQMRNEPGMTKQWHLAHAVTTGQQAATNALIGMIGPRFILEGPQGLFAATCDTAHPLDLPDRWQIADVSFKPWGACRHAHPAIDAALTMRARGTLSDNDSVIVETYADALLFCDRPSPATPAEARFSLQHAVAVVMARGEPRLADFEPDAIAALAPVRARVTAREHADFTSVYPAHFGVRVIAPNDSMTLQDTLGDPERPLARDGVIAKALALMEWGGIGPADAGAAVGAVLEGDDFTDVLTLLEGWL